MRNLSSLILLTVVVLPSPAWAQDERREPIPRYVVDVRAAYARFEKRPDLQAEPVKVIVPGFGLGLDVAAHVYPLRWKTVTFGIGGGLAICRGRRAPAVDETPGPTLETRFQSLAPQVSFNFGHRQGWSYISGGIGRSSFFILSGQTPFVNASDVRLKTINYGVGARWFFNAHMAFGLDLRVYAMNPNLPLEKRFGTPRMNQLVVSSGLSFH